MTVHAGDNRVANASLPLIANEVLTVADFEYSYLLPENTRKFSIKPRNPGNTIKLAYFPGNSGTTYVTIPPGGYWEDLVGLSALTLYFQSPDAGAVVEIVAWS